MVSYLKNKMKALKAMTGDKADQPGSSTSEPRQLTENLTQNILVLRELLQNSSDFLAREITIANTQVSFLTIEGMVNLQTMSEMLIEPIMKQSFESSGSSGKDNANAIFDYIQNKSILATDMVNIYTFDEIFRFIMSGFVVVLIDGVQTGIAFGMQGFSFRSIGEPSSEVNERGSREGFTEPIRINLSMVRRRIKSPKLKFDIMTVGEKSNTDIALVYLTDKASPSLVKKLYAKIKSTKLDYVFNSGSLQAFLEGKPWSLFSDVGTTERPDTLCAKIMEGRIAILVDGTPYALIVPYLFSENFQTIDDYAHRSFYASFIRIIKYLSFITTIFLPGLYVGIGTFHPELLPHALLFNIAAAEEITPFPLFVEALIIHLLYEIMREAGLRLPRAVGHAVSIVGALVIGDAAVTAGLIGAPMVFIVAMTAIASFVVPSLYEPVALLRFVFIIVGGTSGLYGITLGAILLLVNVCTLNSFGMPYMTPISPFSLKGMRDTFVRVSYKWLASRDVKIQNLDGVSIDKDDV